MNGNSICETRFKYKYIVAFLVIFAVGLIFIFITQYSFTGSEESIWKLILQHMSTALIVASLTGLIYELFIRSEFINVMDDLAKVLQNEILKLGSEAADRSKTLKKLIIGHIEKQNIGLLHCYNEVDFFDFANTIEDESELTIVLNDGWTWVGSHFERLKKDSLIQTRKQLYY